MKRVSWVCSYLITAGHEHIQGHFLQLVTCAFKFSRSWQRTETGALSCARAGAQLRRHPRADFVGTFELWAACGAAEKRNQHTAANVALPPHCFPHLRHWAGWAQVFTWQKENIASWILNAIIAAHLARFRGYQYHIKTSCKRHGNFEQLFHPPL